VQEEERENEREGVQSLALSCSVARQSPAARELPAGNVNQTPATIINNNNNGTATINNKQELE
jgi:hypothetical protein